jgi:hypothetical protein
LLRLAEGAARQATASRVRQKVRAKRLREPRHGSAFYTQPAEAAQGNVVLSRPAISSRATAR